VAARALIYVSVLKQSVWPGLFAFVAFATIDGVARYGHLNGWNWFDHTTVSRYYGAISIVIAIEIFIFFYLANGRGDPIGT
jgi:hypothetical protein